MKHETYILPSHYACYLINGDHSSLDDAEIKEIDRWRDNEGVSWCVNVSEESFFAHKSDLGNMEGDMAEFTFEVNE